MQEPPSWIIKPFDIRGAELDKVEFKCQALGSPPAKYTWVDKEGIDATEKEGKNIKVFKLLCQRIFFIFESNFHVNEMMHFLIDATNKIILVVLVSC